jgi:hypothetical protein
LTFTQKLSKHKYKSSKIKKAERLMFRARVKWHEEGEKTMHTSWV